MEALLCFQHTKQGFRLVVDEKRRYGTGKDGEA